MIEYPKGTTHEREFEPVSVEFEPSLRANPHGY